MRESAHGAALIDVDAISVGYGRLDVLHEVSLHVSAGELVAIIGPNGAGKSTVLKAIMGFLHPSAGSISFQGQGIIGRSTDQLVRRGLGYVPQGRVVFPRMTVRENLQMGAFTVSSRQRRQERLDYVYGLFPRLGERPAQLAGTMSGGEQQMLSIGRSLMTQPAAVLLDEPSLGLSPRFVDMVFDQIVTLRGEGLAMLMVEQNAARALEIADRGYVLELGRNRYEGSGADLLADVRVRQMYLGG